MLNAIREKLEALGEKVFYGRVNENEAVWDYIVFGRLDYESVVPGSIVHFFVAIVREDYVPEETVKAVIEAVKGIPGVKLAQKEHPYEYSLKGNTNTVVETIFLEFSKAGKGW